MERIKKQLNKSIKSSKNKLMIIISLLILILIIAVMSENNNWTKYSSFVGQAYKSQADANKESNSRQELYGKRQSESRIPDILEKVPCVDTDSFSAVKNSKKSFDPFTYGQITFTELVKSSNGKGVLKSIKEYDVCKGNQLKEWSCDNYDKNLLNVGAKLWKYIPCEFGCNNGVCNLGQSCGNKIKDGDEEAIDCGGKSCKACAGKQFCEDSDGLNYENKGFVTIEVDNNGKKEKTPIDDICKDEKILLEQACDVNGYVEKEYDCSAACVLGHSFKSINGNDGGDSLPVLFFIGDKKTMGSTEIILESFTYPETCTFVFNDPEANIVSAKVIIPKAGLSGGGYSFNKGGNKITFTVIEAKQFSENRKCDGGKCISLDVCKDIKELISDSMTCIDKVLEPVENQVEEKCSKNWKYYACSEEKQTYIFYQCLLEKFPEFKDNLQLCAELGCIDIDGMDLTKKSFSKGYYLPSNTIQEFTDHCSDVNKNPIETSQYITEAICKDNILDYAQVVCPDGTWCSYGACKEKSVCTVTDCSPQQSSPVDIYTMGSNDWYYDASAKDVDSVISSSKLSTLFSKENFVDNEGANKNTISYSQALLFQNNLRDLYLRKMMMSRQKQRRICFFLMHQIIMHGITLLYLMNL